MHIDAGDEIAKQCYLFYAEIPTSADTLTLPIDEDILVFAVTANAYAKNGRRTLPAFRHASKKSRLLTARRKRSFKA